MEVSVGDQIREPHIRFRNFTDYEAYIKSIDDGYDAEDAIFVGYIYKTNTLQFKLVNRNLDGNGCDFKRKIIDYRVNNCFIRTKGYCFVKCIKYSLGEDYKQQYLDFLRNEKQRSNLMTKARFWILCRANNINVV